MPSFRPPSNRHLSVSTQPAIERMQSQWLFTSSELLCTPSILDGMPVAQELANRSKGVNFITQVGILLKLPQLTLATASIYLHRFFMRHSMVDLPQRPGLHHYAVAATALFLATKVEENCRKMRELVVACCRVAQKQPNLVVDEQNKEFWKWRDTILHNEDLLLESLCFDLQLEQSYKTLFDHLQYYGVQDNKRLRNASWAFLNDSLITTMCLQFSTKTIAGVALFGGASQAGIRLPDDEYGRAWWEHLGLNILDLRDAWNLMAEAYENAALPRQGEKDAYAKTDDVTAFDKTRFTISPRAPLSPAGSAGAESQGLKRERDASETRLENGQNGGLGRPDSPESRALAYGNPPSPKRQRRDSAVESVHMPQTSSQFPAPAPNPGSQTQNGTINGVDSVQQRIDEIINASSQHSQADRSLSRITSQNEQPWPGPPPRRRSSSISNRQRPPSSQGSGQGPDFGGRSDLSRLPSFDRPAERRGSYDQENRQSQEHHQGDQAVSRQSWQSNDPSMPNGTTRPDEGEIADNGSEEGEL